MGTTPPDRENCMSETTTDTTQDDQKTADTQQEQVEQKTTEPDWKAEAEKWKSFARKHEDAAKANADKAKRFDEFEEAQKTELQKAADRAAAAEARAAEVEARAMRAEIASEKGVPASLLSGSTKEELEASADALIAFRGEKPKPDFGGGDRGDDVKGEGSQMTQAEVSKLYAERKYDEIEQARKDGRLANLLGPSK